MLKTDLLAGSSFHLSADGSWTSRPSSLFPQCRGLAGSAGGEEPRTPHSFRMPCRNYHAGVAGIRGWPTSNACRVGARHAANSAPRTTAHSHDLAVLRRFGVHQYSYNCSLSPAFLDISLRAIQDQRGHSRCPGQCLARLSPALYPDFFGHSVFASGRDPRIPGRLGHLAEPRAPTAERQPGLPWGSVCLVRNE